MDEHILYIYADCFFLLPTCYAYSNANREARSRRRRRPIGYRGIYFDDNRKRHPRSLR